MRRFYNQQNNFYNTSVVIHEGGTDRNWVLDLTIRESQWRRRSLDDVFKSQMYGRFYVRLRMQLLLKGAVHSGGLRSSLSALSV